MRCKSLPVQETPHSNLPALTLHHHWLYGATTTFVHSNSNFFEYFAASSPLCPSLSIAQLLNEVLQEAWATSHQVYVPVILSLVSQMIINVLAFGF